MMLRVSRDVFPPKAHADFHMPTEDGLPLPWKNEGRGGVHTYGKPWMAVNKGHDGQQDVAPKFRSRRPR